jgi:hypothetical protein
MGRRARRAMWPAFAHLHGGIGVARRSAVGRRHRARVVPSSVRPQAGRAGSIHYDGRRWRPGRSEPRADVAPWPVLNGSVGRLEVSSFRVLVAVKLPARLLDLARLLLRVMDVGSRSAADQLSRSTRRA